MTVSSVSHKDKEYEISYLEHVNRHLGHSMTDGAVLVDCGKEYAKAAEAGEDIARHKYSDYSKSQVGLENTEKVIDLLESGAIIPYMTWVFSSEFLEGNYLPDGSPFLSSSECCILKACRASVVQEVREALVACDVVPYRCILVWDVTDLCLKMGCFCDNNPMRLQVLANDLREVIHDLQLEPIEVEKLNRYIEKMIEVGMRYMKNMDLEQHAAGEQEDEVSRVAGLMDSYLHLREDAMVEAEVLDTAPKGRCIST